MNNETIIIHGKEIPVDDIVIMSAFDEELRILHKKSKISSFRQDEEDMSKWMEELQNKGCTNFARINNRIINLDYLERAKLIDCEMYNEYSIVLLWKTRNGSLIIDFDTTEEVNDSYNNLMKAITINNRAQAKETVLGK